GVYWQFVNAIKGMGDACKKYDTPVTGGNVSFYNQTVHPEGNVPVYPTPTIGMLGIMDSMDDFMSLSFKKEDDVIVMLGAHREDIGQSQYLRHFHGTEMSPVPYFNLDEEETLHDKIRELIKAGVCNSAHDVSEGGLWTCLLESGFKNDLGFDIRCKEQIRKDALLFGEAQGRIIISLDANKLSKMEEIIGDSVNSNVLGVVTKGEIRIDKDTWGDIKEWKEKYNNAIHKYFEN
ncbi:MAG: phosphoribosylformylglycinamidine synthase subunit PurL, partial [Bacteroidia bacterium]|nr:phosphoribosylformylglycinamidine synthase subunit PurL [Bacteroidia bacterium]